METAPYIWVTLAPHKRAQRKNFSQIDAVLTIESSPSDFVGDCEIQRTSNGYFCRKHRRPVERDATRCDSFVRRRSFENYEDVARQIVEEYVRNVLGIEKGRNYRRLVGWIADAPSPDSEDRTEQG